MWLCQEESGGGDGAMSVCAEGVCMCGSTLDMCLNIKKGGQHNINVIRFHKSHP